MRNVAAEGIPQGMADLFGKFYRNGRLKKRSCAAFHDGLGTGAGPRKGDGKSEACLNTSWGTVAGHQAGIYAFSCLLQARVAFRQENGRQPASDSQKGPQRVPGGMSRLPGGLLWEQHGLLRCFLITALPGVRSARSLQHTDGGQEKGIPLRPLRKPHRRVRRCLGFSLCKKTAIPRNRASVKKLAGEWPEKTVAVR